MLRKYVPNARHILDFDDNGLVNQQEFFLKTERSGCVTGFFGIVDLVDGLPREMILGKIGTTWLLNFCISSTFLYFLNPAGISHPDSRYLLFIKEPYDLVRKFNKLTINIKQF